MAGARPLPCVDMDAISWLGDQSKGPIAERRNRVRDLLALDGPRKGDLFSRRRRSRAAFVRSIFCVCIAAVSFLLIGDDNRPCRLLVGLCTLSARHSTVGPVPEGLRRVLSSRIACYSNSCLWLIFMELNRSVIGDPHVSKQPEDGTKPMAVRLRLVP